jgi:hypothetical protein
MQEGAILTETKYSWVRSGLCSQGGHAHLGTVVLSVGWDIWGFPVISVF